MTDLSRPVRRERVRGFQPPWRTVFVYVCPDCDQETRMNASKFHGKIPVPEIGAIYCTNSKHWRGK